MYEKRRLRRMCFENEIYLLFCKYLIFHCSYIIFRGHYHNCMLHSFKKSKLYKTTYLSICPSVNNIKTMREINITILNRKKRTSYENYVTDDTMALDRASFLFFSLFKKNKRTPTRRIKNGILLFSF